MSSIVIRQVDDWIAVYKDGVKVEENHSCALARGLEALGIPFENQRLDEDPQYGFNQDTLTLADGSDAFPEQLP